MDKYENLYCKMFVNFSQEREDLINLLLQITNGTYQPLRTIVAKNMEIDISYSKEFNEKAPPNEFLFYKYYLDIEPLFSVSESDYIKDVSKLLSSLNEKNIVTVAACDFESDLSS